MTQPPRVHSASALPICGVLLSAFLGASTVVVGEPLIRYVPPLALLGIRFALAALLLAIVVPRHVFPITRAAISSGVVSGLGFGLGSALLFFALPHTRAGKLTFLVSLEVVIVPLLSLLIYRTTLTWSERIALLFAVSGLWLISGDSGGGATWWDLVGVTSAFAFAVYTLTLSHSTSTAPVASQAFTSFVAISTVATGVLLGDALLRGRGLPTITWGTDTVLMLGYIVVFGSLLRFLVQAWSQRAVSAAATALTFTSEPLFAFGLSYTFLGERLTAVQTLGALCILGGLLCAGCGARVAKRCAATEVHGS